MTEETTPPQDIRVSAGDALRIQKQIDKEKEAKTVSIGKYDILKDELAKAREEITAFTKAESKRVETQRQELLKTFSEEVQKEYKKSTLDELEKLSKVLGKTQPKSSFVGRQNAGTDTTPSSGWNPIGREDVDGKTVTKYADGKGNYKYGE